jgi:acetolactate synthase I/II/III large subunit
MNLNGGELAAESLKRHGVDVIYTLSGGHIFPIYDGCVKRDIRLLDVRHEQTATFAAEAHAKLTRSLGVACITAGPGITNAVSAITTGHFNGSPLLVLGGRAPQNRWGRGSLQELDHVPIVETVSKLARTVFSGAEVPAAMAEAIAAATTRHRGPAFLDFPMDALFVPAEVDDIPMAAELAVGVNNGDVEQAQALMKNAERPVIVAGTDVWLNRAEDALKDLAETRSIPVIPNGMGRGCVPSDHALCFSRARSLALKQADLVIVIGTPLDFRLGFGRFGDAKTIHVQDSEEGISRHANPAAAVWGTFSTLLPALAEPADHPDRTPWVEALRAEETARRNADEADLTSNDHPIHPARVYGVLKEKLDRDAILIGDGGDFVSYAGRFVDMYTPGAWLDPGPYGCLGLGLGYAIAARVVHPDKQIVLMTGDGAIGFCGMDMDTLVRHKLPVVIIVGNNGIWGLEKHPMQSLYGYDVAADLNQDTRYDLILEAFGGAGETVEKASELPDAFDRATNSGVPYLLNVLTDPANAYPRSSNLA